MSPELVVTGMGVISAIGQGKDDCASALLQGKHAFDVMRRPGRQGVSAFIGAEIPQIAFPDKMRSQTFRAASLSTQAAMVVLKEAWDEARLSDVNPDRVGLIVGGSNFQQRELTQLHESFRERPQFLKPTYALSFMDSDLCGFCSAEFGIRGLAYTVGGASASGQLAIIQAAQAVMGGQVDVCIALGALMDVSHWECQGFRALGAMGSDRYANEPALASRPFDRDSDGFIFGESCGALIIEDRKTSERREIQPYAVLRGWGLAMDGNRNPDPSLAGEVRVIQSALQSAAWSASQVDYVNPHGTGSVLGDAVELRALRECDLTHVHINATKSLIGHGLSAAGTVEVIATLLQMRLERLHPTRNLVNPVDADFHWIREPTIHRIEHALTLSFGFGGINTAVCWQSDR
jgi:malonyl-ACP decarboxylase